MNALTDVTTAEEARRLLGIYLRDHHAGAVGGISLTQRSRGSNTGTSYEAVLREIEAELAADRITLESIMSRLGTSPSNVKNAVAFAAEVVGRVKSNGRLFEYSPSSRVVELEGIASGIAAKRTLWRTLQAIADSFDELDATELEQLVERATSQHDRVLDAHQRAVTEAFTT